MRDRLGVRMQLSHVTEEVLRQSCRWSGTFACVAGLLFVACVPLREDAAHGVIPPDRPVKAAEPWGGDDAPRVWGGITNPSTLLSGDKAPVPSGTVLIAGTVDWDAALTDAVSIELLRRDDSGLPVVVQRAWLHQPGEWRFALPKESGNVEVWAWAPTSEGPPDVTDLRSEAKQLSVGAYGVRGVELTLGAVP